MKIIIQTFSKKSQRRTNAHMESIIFFFFIIFLLGIVYFSLRHSWWRANVDVSLPRILMYHMISPHLPKSRSKFNRLRVTPEAFEKQLHWLHHNHWQTMSMAELAQCQSLPPKTVVLTFDDGYADNYIHAFPLLKRYNMKATIYIITERFNQNWATDKDTKLSSNELNNEAMLTHEMVCEMIDSGLIDIGSHTIHHANLPTLSSEQKEEEIAHSKTIIEKAYGFTCKSFAYPFGFYDEASITLVQKHGYTSAVTTIPKLIVWENKNRYEVPRLIISGRQSLFDFKLKMLKGRNR